MSRFSREFVKLLLNRHLDHNPPGAGWKVWFGATGRRKGGLRGERPNPEMIHGRLLLRDLAKQMGMVTFAFMDKRDATSWIGWGLLLLACSLVGGCQATPVATVTSWNVKDFGATADGKTLDTVAVNRAIDAASAAGGGTVQFSAGTYLCYSIHLKSNITLQLDRGAKIAAAG